MKFRVIFILCVIAVGVTFSVRFYYVMKAWRDRTFSSPPATVADDARGGPYAATPVNETDSNLRTVRDAETPAERTAATATPEPAAVVEIQESAGTPEADQEATATLETAQSEVSQPEAAASDVAGAVAFDVDTSGSSPAVGAETDLTAPERPGIPYTYTEDWPRFLGPDTNGISRELNLDLDWPRSGPPQLWRKSIGASYSAPVEQGDHLIVFHRLADQEVLDNLVADTGEMVWRFAYPTQYEDRFGFNGGPRSSPAIDDDRVYTFGAEGVLSCVDLNTGKLHWQRNLNEEYGVPQNFFGVGTSPVIEGNLVLINLGGPDNAGVIALNKKLGATVWTSSHDGASYSTPIVRTIRDRRRAIFFTRNGLLVLDPQSGEELYSYPFRSKIEASVNAATPVIVGDVVFLSASYNTGAVALRLGETGLAEVWRDRRAMSNHWATSIYYNGYLYGMDGRHEAGSNFRCIDFQTGSSRWTADQGLGRSSFIMAEGNLIALGERGDLALIEASPERYIEKARVQAMGYPCWTPPILAHGLLFLRSETQIACFDLRKKSR